MNRCESVERELVAFGRYMHAGFPALRVTGLYDLNVDYVADRSSYLAFRADGRFRKYGVYLFYTDAGELLYVGSATAAFDSRIWSHRFDGARWIDAVVFDEAHWPFLLALEALLICRLKPKFNASLKGWDVPAMPHGAR